MKILSLTYEYPPIGGGGSYVAASLNETLRHFGDEVEVVTSAFGPLPAFDIVGDVPVHRARCVRKHRHFTTTAELATTLFPAINTTAKVIKRFRPDVIHTHFALPSGLVAAASARRFGIPFVLTTHGSDIPGYNPDRFKAMHVILKPLWRSIMQSARVVTAPSHFLTNLIRSQVDVPVMIVPNGYTPGPRSGRPKRKLVLVVARMFPRKGVQHFIESVRNLRDDWEFVIAGDGPFMPSLRKQAERTKAPVRFVGFVDRPTLYGLYEEASILVFPSIRENFPMVLLEGMDAGCAIITTDAEGCAEVVGDTGIVIEKGNARQIRKALTALMGDEARRLELAAAAKARVRQFRWPLIANQFRNVFATAASLELPPRGNEDLASTGVFSTLKKIDRGTSDGSSP